MNVERLRENLGFARSTTFRDPALGTEGFALIDRLYDALAAVEEGAFEPEEGRRNVESAYDEADRFVKQSRLHVDDLSRTGSILNTAAQFIGEGLDTDPKALLRKVHRPLEPLDKILQSGRLPNMAEIGHMVKAELRRNSLRIQLLPGPDTYRLSVAACILNDEQILRDTVRHDYSQNRNSYRGQKEGGMREEDLGSEPTEFGSAKRLLEAAEQTLRGFPEALANLDGFRKIKFR